MKKLMFAAVACAAMSGLAIESKNIVGYAGSALREVGNTLTSAQFIDIANSDDTIKLSNIVPVLANGEVAGWGEVEIQYLLSDGRTDTDNDFLWDGEGWTKDWESIDVDIPAGQGLWVNNTAGAEVSLRSSGEVNQKDALFVLRDIGNTAAANCFPTATKLGELLPAYVSDSNVAAWGEVEIQFLLSDGRTDTENDFLWDGEGWTKDWESIDVDIPAGQGLWVNNSAGTEITLRIPAPEL